MADERTLTEKIEIPQIRAEMATLRAATLGDCDKLEGLGAFSRSVDTYGNLADSQRAIVYAWVERSVQWQNGTRTSSDSRLDAQARGVMAWTITARTDNSSDGELSARDDDIIGMIFLVDIDAWNSSARIQVILGENYRGRGYSRDVMPRVMTYGFAPRTAGLGLHRIWMSVPSTNSRSLAVFQSLGFTQAGVSRDALWNPYQERYDDVHIMDVLVDEFDPIQSLKTFGLHAIMENPGIKEALAQHEHTMQIRQRVRQNFEQSLNESDIALSGQSVDQNSGQNAEQSAGRSAVESDSANQVSDAVHSENADFESIMQLADSENGEKSASTHASHDQAAGAAADADKAEERLPWWRMLGANRKRK